MTFRHQPHFRESEPVGIRHRVLAEYVLEVHRDEPGKEENNRFKTSLEKAATAQEFFIRALPPLVVVSSGITAMLAGMDVVHVYREEGRRNPPLRTSNS